MVLLVTASVVPATAETQEIIDNTAAISEAIMVLIRVI
jgi:hypothetical protein